MKIYEDKFSNQYTEQELPIAVTEQPSFQEHLLDAFLNYLTLDNFQNIFEFLPEDLQNEFYNKAIKTTMIWEDIEEVADIDVPEEAIAKNRKFGEIIINIPK